MSARSWQLTLQFALKDFKIRYTHSVLGYAWSVLNPLVFALIYYFAPDAEQSWVWMTPGSVASTLPTQAIAMASRSTRIQVPRPNVVPGRCVRLLCALPLPLRPDPTASMSVLPRYRCRHQVPA